MKKETVYDAVADAMKEREAALKDLREKLSSEKVVKENADAKANEAIQNADADAYTKAKAASREASDKIEFYNIQISNMEKTPLFTDYTEKMAEIKADQQQKIDQINERATKAMHEINNMIADFYTDLEASNKALESVYKNTGFTYSPTITLPIGTIYKSTESVKINPELSKYW